MAETEDNRITNSMVDSGELPESRREIYPQQYEWDIASAQKGMSPSQRGALQKGEGDSLSLDPVKVREAAGVVAQAKKAMEYLKDALDALKTGKNEKKNGEGIGNRPPSAEQIGQDFATQNPPEQGGTGDMAPTLEQNIPGYEGQPMGYMRTKTMKKIPQWLQNPVNGPQNQDEEVLNYMDKQTQR